MIKLEIKDYCQDCPAFEPRVEKFSDYPQNTVTTTVYCASEKKCARLVQYLERKMRNAGNQN